MTQPTNNKAGMNPSNDLDLNFEAPVVSCDYYDQCNFSFDFDTIRPTDLK